MKTTKRRTQKSKAAQSLGSLGGKKTLKKRGRRFYVKISRLAAQARKRNRK